MPIVCVAVPSFKLAVTAPGARGPVLVADRLERGRVVACSNEAAAAGVILRMTLAQGQACAHGARTVVDDPVRDRQIWTEVLDALDAASPLVEDVAEGTAFLEMRGIEGAPARWLAVVREALAGFELPFRTGVGPNPFIARAAALAGDGSVWLDAVGARLAPLPLTVLQLPSGDVERLRRLGIETLGALAALPHGPFVRRFGAEGARWHAHARGLDDRPLVPRARRLQIERTLFGEGSAACEEQVLFALRTLVGRVVEDLTLAGKRCSRLVLELECEDGETPQVATRLAQPTAQGGTLFEILRARIEGLTLTAAVTGLRLRAEELETGGAGLTLFAGDDPDPEALGLVVARLEAALGERTALRARVVEGARPETRWVYEPFAIEALASAPGASRPIATPSPAAATLQYRPFEPQPIDVTLRGGRPALAGTPPQPVLDAAGPWRVAEGWWERALERGPGLCRDEYDLLLEDGTLCRVARTAGDWNMHGRYD